MAQWGLWLRTVGAMKLPLIALAPAKKGWLPEAPAIFAKPHVVHFGFPCFEDRNRPSVLELD